MGVQQLDGYAGGSFQPEVTHTFLAACSSCGAAHPLAVRGISDKSKCYACGEPSAPPGQSVTQVGSLGGGIAVWFARALMAAGRFFASLSEGV